MHNLTSLFLSQSYQDTWDDYNRSISSETFPVWDYIILTASDNNQAEGYYRQIEERKEFLPSRTHFAVIPDEGGVRVGSGGATLSVLKYIYEREGTFNGIRTLVIHSGGDSKRVPTYSALGKLFSPVPHKLPNGRSSTLFDEFIIAMSSIPARIREGMLLLSGDVLLLFNPLQIDFSGNGAAAISFKEHVETGKNHGVFLNGEEGHVRKFLHKQTVETLIEMGAVNENNCVDIDTGAVIFSPEILDQLYSLINTQAKYEKYVNNTVRLSLYGDFLYPLAEDSTLNAFYKEKPEGEFCTELQEARTIVWEKLRPYRMKLLRLAPAKFIHFGTTTEILSLMSADVNAYSELSWSKKINSSIQGETAGYNSVLSNHASIGENCYLEVSFVHGQATVGNNVLLSYIDIHNETVPDNVVLHGLKQKNGKFVCRIYDIHDNPKETKLFGQELSDVQKILGLQEEELWDTENHTLWMANLYPECDSVQKAVASALNLFALLHDDNGDLDLWKNANKKSLYSGFHDADASAIIAWNQRMQELVRMDEIAKEICAKKTTKEIHPLNTLTKIQKDWLHRRLSKVSFSEAIRLQYYIGTALSGKEKDTYIRECFQQISDTILQASMKGLKFNETCKITKDKHVVKLPLRVNWGGGWSDTPPICCEIGGTVLNAAITLNGEFPVEVTLVKIPEKKIIFDSRDMDVHGEFDTIEPLQKTGDPYDPFALQKACLLACGIIPKEGGNLDQILSRLGGGFEMHSEVTNVPKGSGLGTSSILSAACVKAIFEFLGILHEEEDLYAHVLVMEQIMSTGGGWQDQVGGLSNGIKYITSMPGLQQKLKVNHIELSEETKQELNERFCLIYTGQRRLARNLLRDVIGRYIGNEPNSLFALNEIQKIAVLMRFELERGKIDEFAKLLEYHWELSKKIDNGSSNTLIEQIFASIDHLIDGRMVCGAGGGGFLQVILKKGVTKKDIHIRLKEVFQDNPVDVWDCEFV
ncbi:bifunctional fucokinase/fucose-1-phosphate guanylyltransferase [Faecalimonas mobilis]